jgi:hypothetical protein
MTSATLMVRANGLSTALMIVVPAPFLRISVQHNRSGVRAARAEIGTAILEFCIENRTAFHVSRQALRHAGERHYAPF